ncbi:MAG: hypothetical protein GY938_13450 [Ketobacter sp.]|nr:hypothetical protein [Ketobacter sp.]
MIFLRLALANPWVLVGLVAAVAMAGTIWTGTWYNKGVKSANKMITRGNVERLKLIRKEDKKTADGDLYYERLEADIYKRYAD